MDNVFMIETLVSLSSFNLSNTLFPFSFFFNLPNLGFNCFLVALLFSVNLFPSSPSSLDVNVDFVQLDSIISLDFECYALFFTIFTVWFIHFKYDYLPSFSIYKILSLLLIFVVFFSIC